jgi:hypothetical protein
LQAITALNVKNHVVWWPWKAYLIAVSLHGEEAPLRCLDPSGHKLILRDAAKTPLFRMRE